MTLRVRQLRPHAATCFKSLWFADGWHDRPRIVLMTSSGNRRSSKREYGTQWLILDCNTQHCQGQAAVRLTDVIDEADRQMFGRAHS